MITAVQENTLPLPPSICRTVLNVWADTDDNFGDQDVDHTFDKDSKCVPCQVFAKEPNMAGKEILLFSPGADMVRNMHICRYVMQYPTRRRLPDW